MKKLPVLLFAMLLIFSCKKKEETVDPCQNGFLDAGEELPDCGGNCPPCPENFTSSIYLDVNGVSTTFASKSLSFDGTNWYLSMTNDSLNLNLNLGSNGDIGSYSMAPTGSSCMYFGTSYPILSDGQFAISYHDTVDDRMSGLFQVKFSRPGFLDTIRLTSGQFDYYLY